MIHRFYTCILILWASALSLAQSVSAQSLKTPDMAYPKTVKSEAETLLRKAEKRGDGDLLVAALTRLTLADHALSPELGEKHLERIHQYQRREQRPQILALLRLLELNYLEDTFSFSSNIDSLLVLLTEAGKENLSLYPISDFRESIDPGSKESRKYVSNLYDLLVLTRFLRAERNLLQSEALKQGLPDGSDSFALFCYAYALTNYWETTEDQLEQYLARFPEGPYAGEIEAKLHSSRTQHLNVSIANMSKSVAGGHDIPIRIHWSHVREAVVVAYAFPDTLTPGWLQSPEGRRKEYPVVEVARKHYQLPLGSMDANRNDENDEIDLTFPALPYGIYGFDIFSADHPADPLKKLNPQSRTLFSVSDLYPISSVNYLKESQQRMVVDQWSGSPVSDVRFSSDYPVRGDDRYCLYRLPSNDDIRRSQSPEWRGDQVALFTDLAIYRPGETIRWSAIAYEPRYFQHSVDADEVLEVWLTDDQDHVLQRDTVVTDMMGQACGSWRLSEGDGASLGMYRIQAASAGINHNRTVSSRWIEVAAYKAPTFLVEFDRFADSYHLSDTVHVSGTVRTLNEVPMVGQSVNLQVHGGAPDLQQTLITDAEGRFSTTYMLSQLLPDSTLWRYWHWFSVTAQATNAGGESQQSQSGFHFVGNGIRPQSQQEQDTLPANVPLWMAAADKKQECTSDACFVIYNSVPDAHIYYIAYDKDLFLGEGWLHYRDTGRHELYLELKRRGTESEMSVDFYSHYHGENFREYATARLKEPRLVLETEVMRDQMQPGIVETWKLRAHYDDSQKTPARARLMLLLYNSAIAQLAANRWTLHPTTLPGLRVALIQHGNCDLWSWYSFGYTEPTQRKRGLINLPKLQTWDIGFNRYRNDACFDVKMMGAQKPKYRLQSSAESVLTMSADALPDASDSEDVPLIPTNIAIRDSITKVALYEPMLQTDEKGEVSVTFCAPQDNATWLVEALAYDFPLHVAELHRQIVVQRPVMVKPSTPRFLRRGDSCRLMGVVQNTGSDSIEAEVKIELYHPHSLQIINEQRQHLLLAPRQELGVGISFDVPDSLASLGFRLIAVAEGCSDGEQLCLPVLPAAEPLTDTWVFFEMPDSSQDNHLLRVIDQTIRQAGEELGLQLGEGESRSFELKVDHSVEDYLQPQLLRVYDSEATTATAIAHSLWARTVVDELCDTLSDASSLVERLNLLQNADGGYSWIDGDYRRSSDYATAVVVGLMDRLEAMQMDVPEGLHLDRARNYLRDSTDYYQPRIRSLRRAWRHMSLADRGFVAQYMYEHHRIRTARKIARSILEYQVADDYYGGSWSIEHSRRAGQLLRCCWWRPLLYHDQLAMTAHLTEVLHEVGLPTARPKERAAMTDAIRRARQWMLMSKRTTDWGCSSLVADAAYALLRTGDVWDEHYHPVWGSVSYTRSVAVDEVKPHSLHEVSVEPLRLVSVDGKTLASSPSMQSTMLHVGQKVRVEIPVIATQSMDYVTVTVARPACLEPLRQTSGYFFQGRLWGRSETRDTKTRFYIEHLTEGRHLLSFEAYVTHEGVFVQPAIHLVCEYEPTFRAHTGGGRLTVDK